MSGHLQGPPRSTAADFLAAVVYYYASTTSRGPWAAGTSYAVGDTVAGLVGSRAWPFSCFAPGTSDNGAGPVGMGSQRDGNGVGWAPVVYVGERFVKQHGAPPRVCLLIGNGEIGGTSSTRIGDGNLATDTEEIRAYLWGAETVDDIDRYAAVEAMKGYLINVVRTIAPGRNTIKMISATVTQNVVSFGEDRQVIITYTSQISRDAAVLAVAVTPAATLDPMRPNGDLGTTYTVAADAATNATR